MKSLISYIKESQITESILGGILFSVIAIAAAGLSSAVTKDIQYNLIKRKDKKDIYRKFKSDLSSEKIKEINDEINEKPELSNWNDWNSFIEMIENGERFGKITNKAKDVMVDNRYRFLPIEIQNGVKNIAIAA